MFKYVVILITFPGIISLSYPNVVEALSNEQVCRNTVKKQLEETDFGSNSVNKLRPIIASIALADVMNIIKRSNRGELNSFEDRQDFVRKKLERKFFRKLVFDSDAVSYETADRIESLLNNECRGVS